MCWRKDVSCCQVIMHFWIQNFKVKPSVIFLPFIGILSDRAKRKIYTWKNQRRRETTGTESCCAKREIRWKVGKEKCFSGCKEKEVSKGPCGYVPGKAGVVCPRGVKGVCCIANWWSLVNCWRVRRESRTKRLLLHRSHQEMKSTKTRVKKRWGEGCHDTGWWRTKK